MALVAEARVEYAKDAAREAVIMVNDILNHIRLEERTIITAAFLTKARDAVAKQDISHKALSLLLKGGAWNKAVLS